MGWLKDSASYSATRDGWPYDMSVDTWREGGVDGKETTTRKQRAARNTYKEHRTHVRHRARVPGTDGLVEGSGLLQFREGRMGAWSERRYQIEETGGHQTMMRQQACKKTYVEHPIHGRHRARVPGTDGLVEGSGTLQFREEHMGAWSERRYQVEETGGHQTTTQQ